MDSPPSFSSFGQLVICFCLSLTWISSACFKVLVSATAMLNPATWLARSPQGIYGCFSKGHGYIVLHVEVHRARIEHLSNQNMGTADTADNPRCVDLPYLPAPSNESRVLRAGQSHCLFGGQSAFQRLGSICGLEKVQQLGAMLWDLFLGDMK